MRTEHKGHECKIEWVGNGYACPVCGEYLSWQPSSKHGIIRIPEEGDGRIIALISNGPESGEVVRELTFAQAEILSRSGNNPASINKGWAYFISVATATEMEFTFSFKERRLLLLD